MIYLIFYGLHIYDVYIMVMNLDIRYKVFFEEPYLRI